MTVMEQILPQFMITFFEFLAKPLISNGFIVLHMGWSLIHLLTGALILYFVRKEKYPLLVVFLLLVLFEAFEYFISYVFQIILKESVLDTAWDLILGMVSATIAYIFLKIND
jgi:hypothetical protein